MNAENNRFITNAAGRVCMACCNDEHWRCVWPRPEVCACKSTEPHGESEPHG